MKLGLSSLLFVRSSMEDAVRVSAELGSECIEIMYDAPHFMPDYDRRQLVGLKELIDSYGLEVAVHGSFWDLNPSSHHRELWELSIRQAKRSIEACDRLGGEIVSFHPGRIAIPELEWFAQKARQRCVEFVEECSASAREHGVRIALENIDLPYYSYPTLDELGELVSDREDFGINLDIGHAYRGRKMAGIERAEQDLAEAIGRWGKKIIHVHVHDNHGEKDEHLVPGQGGINFKPIVGALKSIDYDGFVVVELFDPGNAVETGRAGLEKSKELLQL